jgi:hypothetical protein
MSLLESLRGELGAGAREPASFQLMGEDLALLPGAALRAAAARYDEELERAVRPELRAGFERAQAAILREAHGWLVRHNASLHTRVAGYLRLGELCAFEYPWPVVAILGICQVRLGLARAHLWGLLGPTVTRLGSRGLEQLAEGLDDVLRRTNRGIFADSVPTVLYGWRCHELRAAGEAPLAEALLDGPLPPVLDGESRAVARGLYDAMAEPDAGRRFERLGALTLRHFGREQAIFSHHLGPLRTSRRAPTVTTRALRRLVRLRAVPAPVIERDAAGRRRLRFRDFALPPGFEMRAHEARVEAFGRAFVTSVTRDRADYEAAVAYVRAEFGRAPRTR